MLENSRWHPFPSKRSGWGINYFVFFSIIVQTDNDKFIYNLLVENYQSNISTGDHKFSPMVQFYFENNMFNKYIVCFQVVLL